MSTMPYWLSKTPELVAMDRYFSGDPDTLADRYRTAIANVQASRTTGVLPTSSDALNSFLIPTRKATDSFQHFGDDWLNRKNPSSGGKFWPHVPTFSIITWFQVGILAAAQKGLGWSRLQALGANPNEVFASEIGDSMMTPADLEDVLPLVSCWVCAAPPGTGSVEVDAVRGPTAVQLVISTPWPKTIRSRISDAVQSLIDDQWIVLHGGMSTSDLVEHEDPNEPEEDPS